MTPVIEYIIKNKYSNEARKANKNNFDLFNIEDIVIEDTPLTSPCYLFSVPKIFSSLTDISTLKRNPWLFNFSLLSPGKLKQNYIIGSPESRGNQKLASYLKVIEDKMISYLSRFNQLKIYSTIFTFFSNYYAGLYITAQAMQYFSNPKPYLYSSILTNKKLMRSCKRDTLVSIIKRESNNGHPLI